MVDKPIPSPTNTTTFRAIPVFGFNFRAFLSASLALPLQSVEYTPVNIRKMYSMCAINRICLLEGLLNLCRIGSF